jgi:hypothetical protein
VFPHGQCGPRDRDSVSMIAGYSKTVNSSVPSIQSLAEKPPLK